MSVINPFEIISIAYLFTRISIFNIEIEKIKEAIHLTMIGEMTTSYWELTQYLVSEPEPEENRKQRK